LRCLVWTLVTGLADLAWRILIEFARVLALSQPFGMLLRTKGTCGVQG
jgi:hypothetical protein